MSTLDASWSVVSHVVSDADHLAAFAALPEVDQAAHLTGGHQLPTDQIDRQPLADIHADEHRGRS